MPNFDRTGPNGKGPKTGRGMGSCGDESPQGNVANRQVSVGGPGRGGGRGRGIRRGNGIRQTSPQNKVS